VEVVDSLAAEEEVAEAPAAVQDNILNFTIDRINVLKS
jgi:hypothetical protein